MIVQFSTTVNLLTAVALEPNVIQITDQKIELWFLGYFYISASLRCALWLSSVLVKIDAQQQLASLRHVYRWHAQRHFVRKDLQRTRVIVRLLPSIILFICVHPLFMLVL